MWWKRRHMTNDCPRFILFADAVPNLEENNLHSYLIHIDPREYLWLVLLRSYIHGRILWLGWWSAWLAGLKLCVYFCDRSGEETMWLEASHTHQESCGVLKWGNSPDLNDRDSELKRNRREKDKQSSLDHLRSANHLPIHPLITNPWVSLSGISTPCPA